MLYQINELSSQLGLRSHCEFIDGEKLFFVMDFNDANVVVCSFFKGFTDQVYRARRKEFADIAIKYRQYVCHVSS